MQNNSMDYTVIYGGGAIRGTAYVGVLKALNELNINVQTIAGSSVGAVFAGLLAVGYNEEEIRDIFLGVKFDLFRDFHFGFNKGFAISKGEVFLDWLRELIEKKFYGDDYKKGQNPRVTFGDIKKNLVIVTTDLTNFTYKEFSNFETPDFEIAKAIRISSTMPGLMPPYKYKNADLVDGDLQKSWPLWKLSKNLYPENGRILEFRLEGDYAGEDKNPVNFFNTVYSCVTSVATNFIMDLYGQKDKYDYVKINTGEVVIVDFNQAAEKREHLIKIGYEQTMNYFKGKLPNKKQRILKEYKLFLDGFKKIESFLVKGQVNNARLVLGDMFLDLNTANDFIDERVCATLSEFKDLFVDRLSEPNFFGMYSVANIKDVLNKAVDIKQDISDRVEELEDYISKYMIV